MLEVIERLGGAPVPASALETLVLPGRVAGYSPALLDELTSAGEIVWSGAGALPGGDGWLVLAPADGASLLLPEPAEVSMTPLHSAVLEALGGGGALFFRMLSDRVGGLLDGPQPADAEVADAIWDLVWAGLLTNDTLGPLRVLLGGGAPRRAAAPARAVPRPRPGRGGRYGFGRPSMPTRTGPPTVSGRWSLLPPRDDVDPTLRAHALALSLLERHGVLTRGAVAAERIAGGFAAVYPVLRAMEEAGQARRGYFVEGLGGAQFALPGAVDRMRALADAVARKEVRRTGLGTCRRGPGSALRGGAALAGPPGRDAIVAPAGTQGGRADRAGRRVAGAVRRARRADPAVLDRRSGAAGAQRGGAGRGGPGRRARAADGGTRRRGAGRRRLAADAGPGGSRVPAHAARTPAPGRVGFARPVMPERHTTARPDR